MFKIVKSNTKLNGLTTSSCPFKKKIVVKRFGWFSTLKCKMYYGKELNYKF